MQGAFVTQCPGCRAKLKLKDKNARGKQIRCPKCAKVFAAAALGGDETASQDFDEFGPLGGETGSVDPFEQPRHSQPLPARVRSARPGSKAPRPDAKTSTEEAPVAKQKAAKTSSNKVALLIVGVLSFGVMFVVCFFAASSLFSGRGGFLSKLAGRAAEGIPVKYLPADPEVVICIRVADILATPAGKAALDDEEFKKPVEMFTKAIGLHPEDVETVTLAIAATAAMRGPKSGAALSQLRAVSGEDTKSQTRCIVIVRTKKPIDKQAFADTFKIGGSIGTGATRFSGFRVFRRLESSSAAFPDATTMILGSVLTVDEILANPLPSVPELQGIDPKQHVVLAVLPQYWPKSENLIRRRDDGPTGMRIRTAAGFLYGDYNIAAVGLTFGEDVRLRMKCVCSSDGSAKDLQKAIAEDIDSSNEPGMDETELPAARGKGRNEQKPKTHLNPLIDPALYDFRAAGRDKKTSLKWSEDVDRATIEFTAALKGADAQEQASRILRRLTFYQPSAEQE
jgi:predicted Zn finger-like uncharacterized protein